VFKSEAAADAAMAEQLKQERRCGELWIQMSPNERYELMSVVWKARKEGLTISEVWDRCQELSCSPAVLDSVVYEEAVREWERRKLKAGRNERYVSETVKLLLRFGEGQLRRIFDYIIADEVEAWMDQQDWDLQTRKSNMGRFSSLWKVAVDKRWASENIIDRLEPVAAIAGEPEIFSKRVCLRLMAVSLLPECNRVVAPLSHRSRESPFPRQKCPSSGLARRSRSAPVDL
jgi:hypothetical protein